MEKKYSFRKISIRNNLIQTVETLIEHTDRYRSIAEFVSEAIRLRIEDLENRPHSIGRRQRHDRQTKK